MDKIINSSEELNQVTLRLRTNIVPAKGKKLRRHAAGVLGGVEETTLDNYYVQMINGALDLIRAGKVAFVFYTRQIRDILSFEPEARFAYIDGAVCVRL